MRNTAAGKVACYFWSYHSDGISDIFEVRDCFLGKHMLFVHLGNAALPW